MARNEDARQLRQDKRSGFATYLTVMAWVPIVVAVGMLVAPGEQGEARGNPLYWLPMLPLAWWAVALTRYEGWAVRSIRWAQAAAPVAAAMVALFAWQSGDAAVPFLVAGAVSLAVAAVAWILYTGSLLQRQDSLR